MSKKYYSTILNYPFSNKNKIFMYKDLKTETLYFSANDIAYCLGYDPPHKAIQNFIPINDIIQIPFINGKLLNKHSILNFVDVLRNLILDTPDSQIKNRKLENLENFRNWFLNVK